jgi:peptide/nickel transport system permease protein
LVSALRAVGSRLLWAVPVLLVVTFSTFFLLFSFGDPVRVIAGETAGPEEIAELSRQYGFDRSILAQYFSWLLNAIQGDLGNSFFSPDSVTETILGRLPATLTISAGALLFAIVFALIAGFLSGLRPGSLIDRGLTGFSSVALGVPNFIAGIVLLLIFAVWYPIFPAGGYEPWSNGIKNSLSYVVLPSIALGLSLLAQQVRTLRASMVEQMEADYVRTARAKDLREGTIIVKHAARNALMPLVTVVGLQISRVVTGAILVEAIFSISGIGSLMVQSVLRQDFYVVQGLVLFFATITIAVNLLVDLSYEWLSPVTRRSS